MKQWTILFCVFACWAANAGDASFAVIENNNANGQIVIPAQPCDVEMKAAAELQEYLAKSTGVTLPVVKEDAVQAPGRGYYLGRTQAASLKGLDLEGEPLDAYQILYEDGKLYIVGIDEPGKEWMMGTAAGTLFGVYRYLIHNVGVRWLWPGVSGEYVPKKQVLSLDASADFVHRNPLYIRIQRAFWRPNPPELYRWSRRVFNQSFQERNRVMGGGGHIFDSYIPLYSKTHPEWFAMLRDGTRKTHAPTSFCLSNPALQQELLNLWQKELDKDKQNNPNAHVMLNLNKGDVELNCVCPECQALDGPDRRLPTQRYSPFKNVGERYAKVALALSRKIQEIDPGSGVTLMAYQSAIYAPRQVKLHPDIEVKLVFDIPFPRWADYTRQIREECLAWRDSGAQLTLRPNYFSTGYCMPEIWYDEFAAELDFLRNECGIVGFDVDGPSGMWSINGINVYVASRMAAETGLSAEEAFREYCQGFGPAEEEISQYLRYWRDYVKRNTGKINVAHETLSTMGWDFFGFDYPNYVNHVYPASELRKSIPLLDAAAEAAREDADASAKVAFLRKGLEHSIMTVETAEIFANPGSDSALRKSAHEKLKDFRKTLPLYAINDESLDRIESRLWKIASGLPKDAILLPEYWYGCPDPENRGGISGFQKDTFDYSGWEKVSTWKGLRAQDYKDYRHMWYRTEITLPPEDSAERAYLCLGAVDEDCKIWINGKTIGGFLSHFKADPDSWDRPFKVDITEWVRYGEPINICVRITKLNPGVGGIWKASWIELKNRLSKRME